MKYLTTVPTTNEVNVVWSFIQNLGAILLVIVGIMKSWEYLHSKTAVTKMQKVIDNHEERLIKDFNRLNKIEQKIDDTQEQIKEGKEVSRLILYAMQELLRSRIDNNDNKSEIEEVSQKISEYLRSKI